MKFSRIRFVSLSCAAGGLASIALVRAPLEAAEFEYKLGHDMPRSHPIGVGMVEFAAAVRRETNGRLDIKVFPDNILGSDPAMVTQLRAGALEMSLQATSPISAISPIANLGFVGYAFKRRRDALAALDGGVGALIRKDVETKGLIGFPRSWETGFRQMTSDARGIRTPADITGMKLRVPISPITVDMWKAFGASPVPLANSEIYTSLQTHVVDGADGPFVNDFAQRLYEVQKFISVTNHQWSGSWIFMNADAWKRLPSDIQAVVARNADISAIREQRFAEAQNAAASDLLVRHGMTLVSADPASFQARLSAYYSKWKSELGSPAWSVLEQYSGKLG